MTATFFGFGTSYFVHTVIRSSGQCKNHKFKFCLFRPFPALINYRIKMAPLAYATEVQFRRAIHMDQFNVIKDMIVQKQISVDDIIDAWESLLDCFTDWNEWRLLLLFDETQLPFDKLKPVLDSSIQYLGFFYETYDGFDLFVKFVYRYGLDFFIHVDPYGRLLFGEPEKLEERLHRVHNVYPHLVDATATNNSPFVRFWFSDRTKRIAMSDDDADNLKIATSFIQICKPDLNIPYMREDGERPDTTTDGDLPLHYAIGYLTGDYADVLVINGSGIDYMRKNSSGETPLDACVYLPLKTDYHADFEFFIRQYPIHIHENACSWTQLLMRSLVYDGDEFDYGDVIHELKESGLRFTLSDTHSWADDDDMYKMLIDSRDIGFTRLNKLVSFGLDVHRRDSRARSLSEFATLLDIPAVTAYFNRNVRPKLELVTWNPTTQTELETVMSCTVCMELLYKPTLMGACGHVVCSVCAHKVDKCPECRSSKLNRSRIYKFDDVLTVLTRKKIDVDMQ
jgi:hypothetical protein